MIIHSCRLCLNKTLKVVYSPLRRHLVQMATTITTMAAAEIMARIILFPLHPPISLRRIIEALRLDRLPLDLLPRALLMVQLNTHPCPTNDLPSMVKLTVRPWYKGVPHLEHQAPRPGPTRNDRKRITLLRRLPNKKTPSPLPLANRDCFSVSGMMIQMRSSHLSPSWGTIALDPHHLHLRLTDK